VTDEEGKLSGTGGSRGSESESKSKSYITPSQGKFEKKKGGNSPNTRLDFVVKTVGLLPQDQKVTHKLMVGKKERFIVIKGGLKFFK